MNVDESEGKFVPLVKPLVKPFSGKGEWSRPLNENILKQTKVKK